MLKYLFAFKLAMDEKSARSGCSLWAILGLGRFTTRKRSKPVSTTQSTEYQRPPSAQIRPSPNVAVVRSLHLQEIPRVSSCNEMSSETYDWDAYFEHDRKTQHQPVLPLPLWSDHDPDPAVFRRGPGAVARLVTKDQSVSEGDSQLSAQALHARGLQALQFHRRDELPHKPAQYTTMPRTKR